jgi:hypothetical protein
MTVFSMNLGSSIIMRKIFYWKRSEISVLETKNGSGI